MFALVDYDNVKLIRRDRTDEDVRYNVTEIARAIASCVKSSSPAISEVDVRFYGGWNTQNRTPSDLGERMLRCHDVARTRFYGLTIRPSIATAPLAWPNASLWGFFKSQRRDRQQKMVDTLITVDALWLTSHSDTLVVSDDQDMVPVLVAGHLGSGRIASLRGNPDGSYFFDDILRLHGVTLRTLPEEFRRG